MSNGCTACKNTWDSSVGCRSIHFFCMHVTKYSIVWIGISCALSLHVEQAVHALVACNSRLVARLDLVACVHACTSLVFTHICKCSICLHAVLLLGTFNLSCLVHAIVRASRLDMHNLYIMSPSHACVTYIYDWGQTLRHDYVSVAQHGWCTLLTFFTPAHS